MGEGAPAEIQHLADCETCRAERGRLEEAFAAFRVSVHEWTDHERTSVAPPVLEPAIAPRLYVGSALRWSLLSAALAMAIIPVYRNAVEQQRQARAEEDAHLLEQVSDQLSRSMPRSIELLVNLLPEDKSTSEADIR